MIEPNRVAARRIARVVSAAADFASVEVADSVEQAEPALANRPALVACDAGTAALLLSTRPAQVRNTPFVVWVNQDGGPAVALAREHGQVGSILGWPSFLGMPRPWELSLAVQRALRPLLAVPKLSELLSWGASVIKWKPRSTAERDRLVAEVGHWAGRAVVAQRVAEKLSEVAHELLMNAMYDAPVDEAGRARYAHDRSREIVLDERELPTLRLGSDGVHLGIEVTDPFGGLRRARILEGLQRGMSGAFAARAEDVLDTSHGGAGLGLHRVASAGAVTIFDLRAGQSTRVLSLFDLDVNPREQRSLPTSLHIFDQQP